MLTVAPWAIQPRTLSATGMATRVRAANSIFMRIAGSSGCFSGGVRRGEANRIERDLGVEHTIVLRRTILACRLALGVSSGFVVLRCFSLG
jgi:hypothetical protein